MIGEQPIIKSIQWHSNPCSDKIHHVSGMNSSIGIRDIVKLKWNDIIIFLFYRLSIFLLFLCPLFSLFILCPCSMNANFMSNIVHRSLMYLLHISWPLVFFLFISLFGLSVNYQNIDRFLSTNQRIREYLCMLNFFLNSVDII